MSETIDTRTNAERRLAYQEMRETSRLLRADRVTTSSSQAIMWERMALEVVEPILVPAARALLAAEFGGETYGHGPDSATVNAHVEQDTPEWKRARMYAMIVLEAGWKAEQA